jgi:hypothetical protein
MHKLLHLLLLVILLCGLGGCVSFMPVPLANGICREQRSDRLLFGMNSPNGPIDEIEWRRFLADTLTPRFPDGLTIYQAQGQWRGPDGRIEHEASRAVEIVHAGDASALERIAAIIANYKSRYQQESVLVISQRVNACI